MKIREYETLSDANRLCDFVNKHKVEVVQLLCIDGENYPYKLFYYKKKIGGI